MSTAKDKKCDISAYIAIGLCLSPFIIGPIGLMGRGLLNNNQLNKVITEAIFDSTKTYEIHCDTHKPIIHFEPAITRVIPLKTEAKNVNNATVKYDTIIFENPFTEQYDIEHQISISLDTKDLESAIDKLNDIRKLYLTAIETNEQPEENSQSKLIITVG